MTDRASLRPGQMARPSAKTKERYGISILFSLPTVGPFPPASHPQQTGMWLTARERGKSLGPWPPPAAQAHRKVTIQDGQTPGIRG